MINSIKRYAMPVFIILILPLLLILAWIADDSRKDQPVLGGYLNVDNKLEQDQAEPVFNSLAAGYDIERFQRPSKQQALKLKYAAKEFINTLEQTPSVQKTFQAPEDVIHAYYAILQGASNMVGYHGGCGTIGWSGIPYPYAYELLSSGTRQQMSLKEFEQSFEGIGYITLLKLYPAFQPPNTPTGIKYYFVEIEVITGPKYDEEDKRPKPSHFAYYYGLITTENTSADEWKIKDVKYVPEDFLCHPMHHWDYDARHLVGVVYMNWYKLIDSIENVEVKDSLIHVYASGGGNKYRFDFVRITNGDDALLHENVQQDGKWKEVNLLQKEHRFYKFSVLKFED